MWRPTGYKSQIISHRTSPEFHTADILERYYMPSTQYMLIPVPHLQHMYKKGSVLDWIIKLCSEHMYMYSMPNQVTSYGVSISVCRSITQQNSISSAEHVLIVVASVLLLATTLLSASSWGWTICWVQEGLLLLCTVVYISRVWHWDPHCLANIETGYKLL